MKKKLIIAIVVLTLAALSAPLATPSASIRPLDNQDGSGLETVPDLGFEVQYLEDGMMKCRPATAQEARRMTQRDPDLELREITPSGAGRKELNAQSGGLKIILRGTNQLEGFPAAKQGFLRAAAVWESIIQTPITIVVDVDFGPTVFGRPFDGGARGETNFQNIGPGQMSDSLSWYPRIRDKLIAGASSDQERLLYNSLPAGTVPTNYGNTAAVFGPAALFRTIGLLSPVADPDGERASLGGPPSIGFSSEASYDFDPSDGIDSDKLDFIALAEHEIGHVLGFFSMSSAKEIQPSLPLAVSVWDLFRFRPGIASSPFTTTPRLLVSGGVHVFFAGKSEVLLSTGRVDYTGGDGMQPHHWKPHALAGYYIGVMDPTINEGEHGPITDNDLDALEAMGYTLNRSGGGSGDDGVAPVIRTLGASLDGDVLSLTVSAADSGGDIAQAQVKLLNGGGLTVAQTSPFAINVGTSPEVSFDLTVTNLSAFPTAVQALLILTDRQGHASKPVIASFNQSVPGGPVISSVSLNGRKMKIKGNGLDGSIAVEINGSVVAQGDNDSPKKDSLSGDPSSMNLRNGSNRIRVRNGTVWSNIYIFDI